MSFRAPITKAFSAVAVLLLSVLLAGCGDRQIGPPPRYAFLGFENISGDPSLDWAGMGASEFLSRSLRDAMGRDAMRRDAMGRDAAGKPGNVLSPDAIIRASQPFGPRTANAPGSSTTRAAALGAGANHLISGYLERTATGVRVTASEEDITTHKTVRTLSGTAASPFQALALLSREFSPQAGPAATSSPEAFRLYCTALLKPLSEAAPLLEQALSLDPGFGHAWVALARTFLSLGNRDDAAETIRNARGQKLAPVDQALLDVEDSALTGDRSAGLAATRKVSELEPADAALARSLASAETNAGDFSQAASVWKRLTVSNPEDVDGWNQLGYSLCWSGDYPGALAALREYARLRPNEPNPLDSQGDIHYWFGKYADAAASYSAAHAKGPNFLNGGELYKAAWAKFRAGDKAGADALFGKFREVREKSKDASVNLLEGDWLFRTGRAKEAHSLLEEASTKESSASQPALRTQIAAQLALWDLLSGDRPTAAKDLAAGGTTSMTPADVMLRFAATPSASAPEWEARAEHMLAAPQLAGLRAIALGYALILDGKKEAAIPVWEKIAAQSGGADFFPRQILARLKNQPLEHLSPPDPLNLNPFTAILDKL